MTQRRREPGNKCEVCGGPFTGDHPQVGITDEYGVHAHVDKGIAPLIQACWARGIVTTGSCQGGGGEKATIGFPSGGYAERFAAAATVATYETIEDLPFEALDWRIFTLTDEADPDGWWWMPSYPWDPGWGVHFPPEDIPELTRRLERSR
jgi:hypothetical protein